MCLFCRVAGSETKSKRRVEWLLLILVVLFASLTVILALTIAVVALELKGDHQGLSFYSSFRLIVHFIYAASD